MSVEVFLQLTTRQTTTKSIVSVPALMFNKEKLFTQRVGKKYKYQKVEEEKQIQGHIFLLIKDLKEVKKNVLLFNLKGIRIVVS